MSQTTALPHPDFNLSDIENNLVKLGLTDEEIVALFGYRTLGFLSNKLNEHEKRWSINPYVFDNNYYKELLDKDSEYLKTPSDLVLLNESRFRQYVENYAKDQKSFFNSFSKMFVKVSELGSNGLVSEVESYNQVEEKSNKCPLF